MQTFIWTPEGMIPSADGVYVQINNPELPGTVKAIENAIECLRGDHIQKNKFRMGMLGTDDIDSALGFLAAARATLKG